MILYSFDIPETREDLVSWLEQALTGIHLSQLVAELKAVHGSSGAEDTNGLGEKLDAVLEHGLNELSDQEIQALLTDPERLFSLQEEVSIRGSRYWQQLPVEDLASIKADLSFVQASESETPYSPASSRPLPAMQEVVAGPESPSWWSHPMVVALATAAAVLLVVGLAPWKNKGPDDTQVASVPATGWGWDRPGALKTDTSAASYLNGLADSADEWFNKRPKNPKDLAVRIAQFRQGCSTLILADHQPLAKADRDWLVGKCQAWAAKLDGHLAAIEAGGSVDEVREAADDTVRKLMIAMRSRADEIG